MRSVTLLNRFVVLVFLFSVAAEAGYKDRGHFSQTFQRTRYFRVFTGTGFDSTGVKRYPVIYYCHGCMGTFQGDQYTSYSSSGGYNPPYCSTACVAPYTKPFNADFQEFANKHEVIVVTVDGNIPGASGCMVWVPYYVSSGWTGNEYRFGLYLRELFHVVDSIYPTKSEPQYRAISGLSMGGAASLWIAAQNQHLFRSMSTFCHSPSYVQIGGPNFTTIVDVTQLWRNFRGLSTRVTSNEGDYIYGMSWQLSHNLDGASVSHEYHRTTFDRHWAYHVDSQFVFHMNTFGETRNAPLCFSAANIYPSYDAWGWDITSAKADSGWIYLKDATRTGFGLVTRKWLPFGAAMPPFAISVKTAPLYNPNAAYTLTSYDYRSAAFAHSSVTSDATGRITVSTPGGMGAEYGIGGNGLAPAMALLTDTVMENIYIVSGRD
ncbi:MAG: hypothetical protein JNL74_11215, partial [Fibrobacteres bacterium]|nr:hypothetical protein [Fibrobacterota bacterium]